MRLRRTIGRLVVAILLAATDAAAQQPICPQVPASTQIVVACRPTSAFPVMRLLSDFTVDHLLKPAPWSFERTPLFLLQQLAFQELKENPDLAKFATMVPTVKFNQLDRSTGTILGVFDNAERTFDAALANLLGDPKLRIELPERLEGGYWRAPDAVQMAFWQNKRIRLRMEASDGRTVEGSVSCLSLTPEGITVTFAEVGAPPLMVYVRGCPL